MCLQHWEKDRLLSQPSVGSADLGDPVARVCLARVQLDWCKGEATDIPCLASSEQLFYLQRHPRERLGVGGL